MTENVLKLLIESEGFLSGEEMSRILGVSRTAIWKHIKKLKEQGYNIESITNKGYMLSLSADQFDKHEFKRLLEDNNLFEHFFTYDKIDSTNKEAKRKAMEEGVSTALIISDEQTIGIGRRGRQWLSEKNSGIYMSMLLRPNIKPMHGSMLTLIAGLAVKKAIFTNTGLECKLKWPNDIVISNKKICGILIQMSSEIDYINYIVIGIGINVNNNDFTEDLKDVATSLKLIGGKEYNRKALIIEIIKEFEKLYKEFLTCESLDFIIEDYNKACVNIGKKVRVEMNGKNIVGEAIKVVENGGLMILSDNGEELIINSGEVSVRGLYGYI